MRGCQEEEEDKEEEEEEYKTIYDISTRYKPLFFFLHLHNLPGEGGRRRDSTVVVVAPCSLGFFLLSSSKGGERKREAAARSLERRAGKKETQMKLLSLSLSQGREDEMSHFSSFISCPPPPPSCVQLRAFFAPLVPQLFRAGKRRIFCPVVFLLLFSLFLLFHFLAKRFLKAATAEGYKKGSERN